jgi:hypothetical protein
MKYPQTSVFIKGKLLREIMKKKETVGKVASDLIIKAIDNNHSAHEQMQESLTDYESNVFQCINDNKAKFPDRMFIVVLTKKEKLLQNVLRNYFFARSSCPTPDYDQTVYQYNYIRDDVEFLWTVPARDICHELRDNALSCPDDEKELLGYVLSFGDGTLFQLAKKLNGEAMHRGGLLLKP